MEIAFLHIDQGKTDLAISCLEDAKKNYTGYSLESRFVVAIKCGDDNRNVININFLQIAFPDSHRTQRSQGAEGNRSRVDKFIFGS